MKITVIAPYTFGYIDSLVAKLEEYPDVSVIYINYQDFRYQYATVLHRIYNFFLKTFLRENLKDRYKTAKIKKLAEDWEIQDYILIIRPDKLERGLLTYLKTKTRFLISYYFDSIAKFPVKAQLISYFDKVYSYEKVDVRNFNLEFITNFMPQDDIAMHSGKGVFNISSKDNRILTLQKIAVQLEHFEYPFQFIVRSEKPEKIDHLKVIQNYFSLNETREYIAKSSILLDIQKDDQLGLTFRVFEAMQFAKKLITTNTSIIDYDFYHPDNILVIDKNHPLIPEDFLTKPYKTLPETVLNKYKRGAWLEQVFGLEKTS